MEAAVLVLDGRFPVPDWHQLLQVDQDEDLVRLEEEEALVLVGQVNLY